MISYFFRFLKPNKIFPHTIKMFEIVTVDGTDLWHVIACEPDIIFKILSYLSYQDINNLEESSKLFEILFEKAKIWKRKIKQDFSGFNICDEFETKDSDIYWHLRYLSHYCNSKCYNICNICFIKTHCFNITKCNTCDYSKLIVSD